EPDRRNPAATRQSRLLPPQQSGAQSPEQSALLKIWHIVFLSWQPILLLFKFAYKSHAVGHGGHGRDRIIALVVPAPAAHRLDVPQHDVPLLGAILVLTGGLVGRPGLEVKCLTGNPVAKHIAGV